MTTLTENLLPPDRLFPDNPSTRHFARDLYNTVKDLPIISPHGHTDPAWFADNKHFKNPVELIVKPDHYLYRMLYSQGIRLGELGISGKSNDHVEQDPRAIWRLFCRHLHLFRGTPSKLWLDYVLYEIFQVDYLINGESADKVYDHIANKLKTEGFRPRELFDRFNIEYLCTTESAVDDLQHHDAIHASDWYAHSSGKIITSFRPDSVVDPDYEGFIGNIHLLGEMTNQETTSWKGYLQALRLRRQEFIKRGATASDHGHPTARTENLSESDAESLFQKVISGVHDAHEAELFRGQMLTEMAKMSVDDGLVMQLHVGSYRNHNIELFEKYGRDRGADIPLSTDFVHGLKPLLDLLGNERGLTVILFTLDETTYARELAPLAGHYPILKIGPPWWFHDSVEGMKRYRQQIIETAGFYNTAGFNDDTRAFFSIPARHDVARRVDCSCLAQWVAEHRLSEEEAYDLAQELTCGLVRKAYRLV